MHVRRSTSAVAILLLVAGCGGQDDFGPADSGVRLDTGVVAMHDAAAIGGPDAGASPCPGGGTGGGNPGAGASVPATFETVKLVFGGGSGIMPCAAAPCHGINGVAPPDHPLELPPSDDQQLYANLLAYVSKACNNTKLVEPCNPAQSALVTILKGPCGSTPRMPYGCSATAGDCIPDEYVEAVSQWIANGAPR